MEERLQAEYSAYLERARSLLPEVTIGQYVKIKGRLIKMLTFPEFVEKWDQLEEIRDSYEESMERGDTVNDAVVHLLDEHLAELLLKP